MTSISTMDWRSLPGSLRAGTVKKCTPAGGMFQEVSVWYKMSAAIKMQIRAEAGLPHRRFVGFKAWAVCGKGNTSDEW
jgi:hypothetical protein